MSFGIEDEDDGDMMTIGAASTAANQGFQPPKQKGMGLVLDHGISGNGTKDENDYEENYDDIPVTNQTSQFGGRTKASNTATETVAKVGGGSSRPAKKAKRPALML